MFTADGPTNQPTNQPTNHVSEVGLPQYSFIENSVVIKWNGNENVTHKPPIEEEHLKLNKMPSMTLIARTYYLNLTYFCRKYTIFTKFYEFMLQKVLKFANYAVVVLV